MKVALRLTMILAAVIAFAATSANAQSINNKQTFVVPFEFSVGGEVLPAGEYRITGETQTVRIQSKDSKQTVTTLPSRTIAPSRKRSETKLTFQRSGDQYYLSQIWLSDGIGRELKNRRNTHADIAGTAGTVVIAGTY